MRLPTRIVMIQSSQLGRRGYVCPSCSMELGRRVWHEVKAVEVRDARLDRVIECPIDGSVSLCLADAS